jgi:protein-tyrosine-phosphatase
MAKHSEKTVLFLCTGNYYRSRFAEALFNSVAGKMGLPCRASSRGLWWTRQGRDGWRRTDVRIAARCLSVRSQMPGRTAKQVLACVPGYGNEVVAGQ